MLYIIYQEDKPDATDLRAELRPAHFEYLDANEDILVLGGAMLGDDGEDPHRQCADHQCRQP